VTRSRSFFAVTAVGLAMVASLVVWANREGRRWQRENLPRLQRLAARLELTDLALWTEARYTRHPSQTDLFSAFQDFPAAPEHFPAGSITPPPPALRDPSAVLAPTSRRRGGDDQRDQRRRDVGATSQTNAGDGSP
jgi:hypothetical protein